MTNMFFNLKLEQLINSFFVALCVISPWFSVKEDFNEALHERKLHGVHIVDT